MTAKLKRLFALTDEGARSVARAGVTSFFSQAAFMIPMMVVMFFLKEGMEGRNLPVWAWVGILIAAAAIMYFPVNVNYKGTYSATYKECANIRLELSGILKEMPLSAFSKKDIAELSGAIMNDVATLEHAISHAVPQCIGFVMFFALLSVMMLLSSWQLALCVIIPIGLGVFFLALSRRLVLRNNQRYYDELQKNADSFQEAIDMHEEICAFGREESIESRVKKAIDESEKIHIVSELTMGIPVSLGNTIMHMGMGLCALVGTSLLARGQVSLLYVLGYCLAAVRLADAGAAIVASVAELFYIDSHASHIKELRNVPLQKGEGKAPAGADITMRDVKFSYRDGTRVLNGVSFDAPQGKVTALVGPSGCGKTTVLRLLSRLYDADEGVIRVGGESVAEIAPDEMFKSLSIVFQDVMLFNTTVMENIRIGRADATDEEVMEAARAAGCDSFVAKLPDGYKTMIGENGSRLSGGERQRLSIARAMLKNAPIILLDEISASLDVENERYIQDSLNRLMKNKTIVMISHRLNSIRNVDRIVVMKDGVVEAQGTHEELKETSPTYRAMLEVSA